MFERFTPPARDAVVLAQEEARGLRHGYLGTEHILLGVLAEGNGAGARVLRGLGITLDAVRSHAVREIGMGPLAAEPERDQEALRSIGIDVDEIRRRVEEDFGPGALDRARRGRRRWGRRRCDWEPGFGTAHVPFTPRAKKVLELSLREAVRLGSSSIGTEHILLGIVREGEGLAARILAASGATAERVRHAVHEEIARGGNPPGRSA